MCFTGEPFNYCAILDDYEMGKMLGKGGFGAVYLATNKLSNKQFAVKFMDMTQARKWIIILALDLQNWYSHL